MTEQKEYIEFINHFVYWASSINSILQILPSSFRSALFKLDLEGNCGELITFVNEPTSHTVSAHLIPVCSLPPKTECLSGDNLSVSCPRLSPDGSTLIYLQGRVFGPHHQCLTLQQVVLSV